VKLSQEQIQQFESDGYLFFPGLFTPGEIKILIDEVPRLYAQHRPEKRAREGSDAVRTNFAAHMYSYPFAKLARHPRMVEPIVQLVGEELYMHQFKINGKMAFDGDVWQWHQDYGTWKNDDLMPEARAMNVAIFLTRSTSSTDADAHSGQPQAGRDRSRSRHLDDELSLWTINHDTIRKLVERGGIVAHRVLPGR